MLQEALNSPVWKNHKVGDFYTMDGKPELWKIAYYPLFGTWDNKKNRQMQVLEHEWVDFKEPRALIERPIEGGGTDFREVPLFYLTKAN